MVRGVTGVVLAAGASERMGEPKLLLPYRGSTVLNATIAAVAASSVSRIVVVTGAGAEAVETSITATWISSSPSSSPSASSSPSGGGADEGGGGGQTPNRADHRSKQGADVGGGEGQGPKGNTSDPSRQRSEALPPSPEGREEGRALSDLKPSITVVRNPDYRRGNMSSFLTATDADPEADAFIIVPGDLPSIHTSVIDGMIGLWVEKKPWAAVTEYSNRIAHPFLLSSAAVESMGELAGEKVLGRLLVESHDARVLRLRVPYGPPRDLNTPDDYEALLTDL